MNAKPAMSPVSWKSIVAAVAVLAAAAALAILATASPASRSDAPSPTAQTSFDPSPLAR